MNSLFATNWLQQFHSDFLKEMSVLAMYLRFQAFACVLEAGLEHLELEGQGFVTPSPAESLLARYPRPAPARCYDLSLNPCWRRPS